MQEVGQWVTIRGRKVFIAEGESLENAMARQGIPARVKEGDLKFVKHGTKDSSVFMFVDKELETVGSVTGGISGTTAAVDLIETEPGMEGRGVGSSMLKQFEKWAVEEGATEILIEAAPIPGDSRSSLEDLVAFYKKNGYDTYGDLSDEDIKNYGMITMVKRLS